MGLFLPPSTMAVIHLLPLLLLLKDGLSVTVTLSTTLRYGSHPSPSSPPPSQGNAPPGGPPGGMMGGPPGGMMGGPPGGMMGGPPDDINPKEFIVGILRNFSVGFKMGVQMPPQALQPFMIDMIPENHKLQKSSEKLLKPK